MNRPLSREIVAASLGLGILACAVIGAAGCSKYSSRPDYARMDDEAVMAAKQPVNILDTDLRKKVAADIADATRLGDGRLLVRLNLRNSTKKDLFVEARTVFKDELGISTGDETAWQPIKFAPQQIRTYVAESRTTDVKTFTVEVKLP